MRIKKEKTKLTWFNELDEKCYFELALWKQKFEMLIFARTNSKKSYEIEMSVLLNFLRYNKIEI